MSNRCIWCSCWRLCQFCPRLRQILDRRQDAIDRNDVDGLDQANAELFAAGFLPANDNLRGSK
jgi:hypothetical protein